MLLTVTELLNYGLPISSECEEAELSRAIFDVEFQVSKRIGTENYISLTDNPADPTNYIILNGGRISGKHIFGLKNCLAHLAFARLLQSRVRLTAYGQVEKRDEYSNIASKEDIYQSARFHYELGTSYLDQIIDYYDIDTELWDSSLNELYF